MVVDWSTVTGRACELIRGYNTQGTRPTLRQVHYRLASEQAGGYQNTQAWYKGLSERLVKTRMENLILWDSLADHVRYRRWIRPGGGQVPDISELIEAVEYFGVSFELERVALTYGQVHRFNLLPNSTKKADPRAREYIAKYGDECWELDALEPRLLQSVVEDAVRREIDPEIWNEVMDRNEKARAREELRRRLKG